MGMTRLALIVVLLSTLAVASVAETLPEVQDGALTVKKVRVEEPEFNDLTSLLHVLKIDGDYEFQGTAPSLQIQIDFYRKGVKLPQQVGSGRMILKEGKEWKGRFSVQIADLDYLPLQGGKKNTLRFQTGFSVSMTEVHQSMSGSSDLPKDVFNLELLLGGGEFRKHAAEEGRIPLFWKAIHEGNLVSADSTKELVERNPDCSLMIAYLVCR